MKGKIIVLDNKVEATKNMIVKNKYVIAQSSSVSLDRTGGPLARDNNRDGANLIEAWADGNQMLQHESA